MGLLPVKKTWEHIAIEYEGGEVTVRFREYNQTLKLFKKVQHYGENKVVISSSGWFEHEHTVERGEHQYLCMLCTGGLLLIEAPRGADEYGDECVVLKISNKEDLDMDVD
jgi:hypothetical protein